MDSGPPENPRPRGPSHIRGVDMATVHTYPVADLIEHELEGDRCPCGPTSEHVPNPHGPDGWLIIHHSLDGREQHEPDATQG